MGAENGAGNDTEHALSNASTTTDQGAGSAASTEGDSTATTVQASPKPTWKDVDWTQVDVQELIRSVPQMQGVLGNMSQAQAQKLARKMLDEQRAEIEAEEARRRVKEAREEKRRLAREDPDKLAERIDEELTREEYEDWQNQIRQSMQRDLHGYIASQVEDVYADPDVQEAMQAADRETMEKLDWRRHSGLASWVKTVNKVVAEYKAEKKAQKRAEELVKARTKAAEKEGVVESARNDAADGVDLGLAGGVPGGRIFTREDLNSMSLEDYRKYKKIIDVQYREGRLK